MSGTISPIHEQVVAQILALAMKMMRDSWATGDGVAWQPAFLELDALVRSAIASTEPEEEYSIDQWWVSELEGIQTSLDLLTMDQYRAIHVARKFIRKSLSPEASMPEFADHSITIAIPERPSVGWFKRVAHQAGLWPDVETVPHAIWTAVMKYQEAMVEVANEDRAESARCGE